MKKLLIFIAGIIVGAAIFAYEANDQLILSEKNEKTLLISEMKVFQVIGKDEALVFSNDQIYLLLHNDTDLYYDNQKIQVSKGTKVKQIGIYRYENKEGFIKTVPAIRIESINNNKQIKSISE
ncbi:MAG: hypothetical protein IJ730_06275 [Alphaproteobacteria bacterium]|nr:hypothetical protein [Alphaproteobacteria bacterium]